jgi:hypothetical protein
MFNKQPRKEILQFVIAQELSQQTTIQISSKKRERSPSMRIDLEKEKKLPKKSLLVIIVIKHLQKKTN